jgi:hypothetical protein
MQTRKDTMETMKTVHTSEDASCRYRQPGAIDRINLVLVTVAILMGLACVLHALWTWPGA